VEDKAADSFSILSPHCLVANHWRDLLQNEAGGDIAR
jgi:hypothetical protein